MIGKDGKTYKITVKQERFISEYLVDGNASRAYKAAYNCSTAKDETIRVKASQLLNKDNVRTRLSEINAIKQANMAISSETITQDCQHIYNAALETNQLAAAVSAKHLQSKINGLLIDKSEVRIGQSPEAWIQQYKERLGKGNTIDHDQPKLVKSIG